MNPIRTTNAPLFRLRLAWDGEPVAVSAELLEPLAWKLALHRDPSNTFWSVSDIPTGRLIETGWSRDDAINAAHRSLQAAASARGTTIKELLEAARTKRENSVMPPDTGRTAERATR
ncbi:hypothetical protein [Thiobaca trueperi]|uniref:Uncharacterized protein n=1 Tax=Thiobaca trueperi TaxID=127458 RepID=A0A4R3MX55_9GAMM|nr:hypothetical protein [Thiobaca trueperi]TCT21180.1 hypothetical protein EDC35_10433 [Thiobaca trueperi]